MTRREKPATSQWLIEQRKRRGWKPEDVAARLDAAVTTVRGWESGRSIGGDSLIRLEAIFGTSAPSDAPASDQSDLVAAVRENTAMLKAVLEALTNRLPPSSPQPPDAVLGEWSEAELRLATEKAGSGSLPRKPSRGRRGVDRATESQGA